MTSLKRKNTILIAAVSLLSFAGCMDRTGDVLVAADGTVMEGELQTIGAGSAVFSHGAVDLPDHGRVWGLDGRTFSGEVMVSAETASAGSHSIPRDSVYLIIWENSENDIEIKSETFEVDAAFGWLDTGIELELGEILSLRSTGTVVTETGTADPQGQEKYSSSVSLVPAATSGELVFQIGADGVPVAAGDCWIGESPGTGSLMLAVNVPLEGSMDSRGVYSVMVEAGTYARRPGTVVFYPADR